MALSSSVLAELAAALGIATEFWDWKGRLTEITDETGNVVVRSHTVMCFTGKPLEL